MKSSKWQFAWKCPSHAAQVQESEGISISIRQDMGNPQILIIELI